MSITVNKQTADFLEQLVRLGLHGTTRAEVIRTLVSTGLERLIATGILKLPE